MRAVVALSPVRTKIEPIAVPSNDDLRGIHVPLAQRPCHLPRAVDSRAGLVGDPALATPEKGEICVEIIADWLKDVIIANWGRS